MKYSPTILIGCCLFLLLAQTAGQTDPSVPLSVTRCEGPYAFPPPVGNVPQICGIIGFSHCSSFALNVTIQVDHVTYVSESVPDPLTFTVAYDLGVPGCQAVFGLASIPAPIITPTYISATPIVRYVCFNQEISKQTLDPFTLGADCSAMDCYNCTQSRLCGWCSNEADFSNQPSTGISDWNSYVRLNTNGKCVGRGPNSTPWCYSCKNTYAVNQNICPVYTGGSSAAGGGGASGGANSGTNNQPDEDKGGLFGGSKSMQALFAACIILIVLLVVAVIVLCYKRRQSTESTRNAAYTKQSVELHETDSPNPNFKHRLMSENNVESDYVPPTVHSAGALNSSEGQYRIVSSGVPPVEEL